ncbi:MAG: hypothetical protein ACK5CK_10050 [Burkholderiaceae bacterium]
MRPFNSQATQLTSVSEAANPADRELLIDIDFFDAKGRLNPTHVVFCPAEDQARAKSLWTRCFRGFMALHGKLWAKNYLSSHFRNKPESKVLLEQIKRSGIVDNKMFRDTVAQCTLLYEDLEQVATGKVLGENRIVPASPIKDLDKIVSQHFLKIDWKECAEKKQFEWLTLGAARNIQKILIELNPNEKNDQVAEQLDDFMDKYEKWLGNPPKNLEGIKSSIDIVLEAADQKEYRNREEIADIIFDAVDNYIGRSEENKIVQEKIVAPEYGKKKIEASREVKYWSFVENKNTKKKS